METVLLWILIVAVAAGLVLAAAAFLQIKRQGGFEQAMALTPAGKWPPTRLLFAGAMTCFGIAMFISYLD